MKHFWSMWIWVLWHILFLCSIVNNRHFYMLLHKQKKRNNVKNDVRSFLYGCYCCRCCCCFLSCRHSANFFMLNFSLFTRFILFGVRIVSHRIQLNKSFCRGVMLSDFGYGFPFQWILHTYCILLYYIVCIYIFFSFSDFSSSQATHGITEIFIRNVSVKYYT